MTRSAARLGFAVLLLGAGAAAVGARPSAVGSPQRLEVVAGDPRLDMAWALTQRGMAADDAARVSVLLVDQIDTRSELVPMKLAWAAELWWQPAAGDAAPMRRMVRTLIDFHWGAALQSAIAAQECDGARAPFLAMKTLETPGLPVPPDTFVLVRILVPWSMGTETPIGPAALAPLGAEVRVECLPVTVDLDHGVAAPAFWPAK